MAVESRTVYAIPSTDQGACKMTYEPPQIEDRTVLETTAFGPSKIVID
jgi:hypothetical protein